MMKTFTIDVNSAVVNITVIVETVGTVNVTVTNNAMPPLPIVGATVTIGTISAVTDANGLAILQNVPQGTQTGTITTA